MKTLMIPKLLAPYAKSLIVTELCQARQKRMQAAGNYKSEAVIHAQRTSQNFPGCCGGRRSERSPQEAGKTIGKPLLEEWWTD